MTEIDPVVFWTAVNDAAGPDGEIVLFSGRRGEGDIVARAPIGQDFDFGAINATVGSIGIVTAAGKVIYWQNFDSIVRPAETVVAGRFEFIDPS